VEANKYQEFTLETAIYPDAGQSTLQGISYCALGLTGEAGEVADKVKKLIRDGDTEELREAIVKEVSDVCWYLARIADELGWDLSALFELNASKLLDRKDRGVLGGSGDER
jgi:NTP pyrophosphatase (non-canonical NTP hydrolase)